MRGETKLKNGIQLLFLIKQIFSKIETTFRLDMLKNQDDETTQQDE